MNPVTSLLEELGGPQKVGDALGLAKSTVLNWPGRRIPPEHFPDLLRFAKRRRVALELGDLEAVNRKLLSTTRRRNGGAR